MFSNLNLVRCSPAVVSREQSTSRQSTSRPSTSSQPVTRQPVSIQSIRVSRLNRQIADLELEERALDASLQTPKDPAADDDDDDDDDSSIGSSKSSGESSMPRFRCTGVSTIAKPPAFTACPPPTELISITNTEAPESAASIAAARPAIPAPTMMTSASTLPLVSLPGAANSRPAANSFQILDR